MAGRSEVSKFEKVAGPVMWRLRLCLLPAATALKARDETRAACILKLSSGWMDGRELSEGKEKTRRA
jgi:hypothetical protein